MTTKTYNNDPLGILTESPKNDPLGILGENVKKKEETTSTQSSVPSLSASASAGSGISVTPPSQSQYPSASEVPATPVESPFEFGKYRNKTRSLPANIPRTVAEISKVISKVENGTVNKQDLSDLYNSDYGKPIVENLVQTYAPKLGTAAIDLEELSTTIKIKNRTNATIQQEQYIRGIDQQLTDAFSNFKTVKINVSGGTGGAAVNENTIPLPVIDINNPWEYGRVINQIKAADDIVDAEGNRIPGKKEQLLKALDEKAKYYTAKQGIDQDILAVESQVNQAVTRANLQRELGENPVATSELLKNDKLNEEHFKIGLSYLKNVQPGQYKNVMRVISEGKSVPDDDFRNIASVGQEIKNQQVFFGAAENPELIDKETAIDYTTRSDKKAEYAAIIGERIKAAGFKNWREYPEAMIKKFAYGLDNQSVVQELANEEKLWGYDAIPKSGVVEGALVQGINQPIDGIRSTFELFSESPVDTYIRSKKLDTGSAQKVVNEKGEVSNVLPSDRGNLFYDAVRGLGQFIPQVLLTKGIGGATAGVIGADARIALIPALRSGISTYGGTAVSTFLQSYGDSYADYLQKTGDAETARLGATIDAGSAAAFELLLPDVKIADRAMAGLKSGLSGDIIELVKKGGDPAELAKKARPFVQKFVTNTLNIAGQEVAEEDGTQLVDYITEAIFSPQTAKDRDLGKELLETTMATAVSMSIPALFGGGGSSLRPDFTKQAFTAAAIGLDSYRQALDRQLDNGVINQNDYNEAIKLLTTHNQSITNAPKQDINGTEISGARQLDYAYEDTKIKVYKEKAANSDGVAKEMWESKIKQSEDLQRAIVMPAPVAVPATSAEDEFIVDETPNTLSPQDTITKAVNDEVITGVEADLIKQGTATADDILLSLAKQKYGVSEDGSLLEGGGRDISMKTSLDVDEAVEKIYPNQQSVVDAIKKASPPASVNIPASVSVIRPEENTSPIVARRPVVAPGLSVITPGQNRPPEVVPLQTPVSRISVSQPGDNAAPNVVPLQAPPQPKVDLGERVQTSEAPLPDGVTPVTLSGLTEQERQSRIEKRKKETSVSDTQKRTNDLIEKVRSYNKLPNGRLGKTKPAGLQSLNNIRLQARELGYTFDDRAGVLRDAKSKVVRPNLKDSGDRSIDDNAIVLRDRSQQVQDVFNQISESGNFPNGYRLDNKQMSAAELDGAIEDIVDGIPSQRANNYLNQLEKQIESDAFEIGNPGELKMAVPLRDLLGVKSEVQSEPMTEDMLQAWLNDESELTPEQEEILIDNFENILQDYEPERSTENAVQSTQPAESAESVVAPEQNSETPVVETPTSETSEPGEGSETSVVDDLTNELRSLLGNEAIPFSLKYDDRRNARFENYNKWKGVSPIGGNEIIKVYRTIQKDDPNEKIQPGDWVSKNKEYVEAYGEVSDRIIEDEIPARYLVDVQTGELPGDTLIYTPEIFDTSSDAFAFKGDTNPKNRVSFEDLGLSYADTLETFIDKLISYGGQYTNLLTAIRNDPNFKNIQLQLVNNRRGLENGEAGLYYPVGYGEGMDGTMQIANKDNVYYTAAHELMHFMTLDSQTTNEIKNTESYKALTDLYNYIAEKKGKPVAIAGGATLENYGLTNEKEFMAELLINPTFRNYVIDVFAANRDDIFKSSKAVRDSKVNSIGDIIFNFFRDLFDKLLGRQKGVAFDTNFPVVMNAAKLATDLFFGGQDIISTQPLFENKQGGAVLNISSDENRAAALALPSTNRGDKINGFVKSALDKGLKESDIKQALLNNGISESDAQSFIDNNKALQQPSQSPAAGTKRKKTDDEKIADVVNLSIDERSFPTIFENNKTSKQLAAETQGAGQNREVDGDYVIALESDLRQVSVQSAALLRNELGANWGEKTIDWMERNPKQGDLGQIIGLLNIISTDIFQDIQDTHDSKRVAKLKALQRRVDNISNKNARMASLGLRQRILYSKFAQGESLVDTLSQTILSDEMKQLQSSMEEILTETVSDKEINTSPPLKTSMPKKKSSIRNIIGSAKRRSNPDVRNEIINKGAEVANSTKKTFKELVEEAKAKLNNIKC